MDRYKINHQNASTPFLFSCAIYHLIGKLNKKIYILKVKFNHVFSKMILTGPIVGILSYRYSLRSLQMTGVCLASVGVFLVKLSTNFTMVIIGVGIIQGIGLGVIRTLGNVVIQQFFYKYRGIATAIR